MPLTDAEAKALTKSIFYADGPSLAGMHKGWHINKEYVFNLLQDYCPDTLIMYKESEDGLRANYKIDWKTKESA